MARLVVAAAALAVFVSAAATAGFAHHEPDHIPPGWRPPPIATELEEDAPSRAAPPARVPAEEAKPRPQEEYKPTPVPSPLDVIPNPAGIDPFANLWWYLQQNRTRR